MSGVVSGGIKVLVSLGATCKELGMVTAVFVFLFPFGATNSFGPIAKYCFGEGDLIICITVPQSYRSFRMEGSRRMYTDHIRPKAQPGS